MNFAFSMKAPLSSFYLNIPIIFSLFGASYVPGPGTTFFLFARISADCVTL
jgi:hypothetical protein